MDERLPGLRVQTSPIVWLCAHDFVYKAGATVPLIMADEMSLFRQISLDTLSQAGISWRILGPYDGRPTLPDVNYYLYIQPSITPVTVKLLFTGLTNEANRFGPDLPLE